MSPADRILLDGFISAQRSLQAELLSQLRGDPARAPHVAGPSLNRAFEFLQACDSLSLTACVRYPGPIPLRHAHPLRDGTSATVECLPLGRDTYRLAPFPLRADEVTLTVPCRRLPGRHFASDQQLRDAYAEAPVEAIPIRLVR